MSLQAATAPTSPCFPPEGAGLFSPVKSARAHRRVSLVAGAKRSPAGSPASSAPTSPHTLTAPSYSVPWGKVSTSPPTISALTAAGCFGSTFVSDTGAPSVTSYSGRTRHTSLLASSARPNLSIQLPSPQAFVSTAARLHQPNGPTAIPLKSALRLAVRDGTRSSPVTPNKSVRFPTNLERVKLFLKVETPATVSHTAEYFPGDDADNVSDTDEEEDDTAPTTCTEMVVTLVNFPPPTVNLFHSRPVRLENVALASDKSKLLGSVQVQNLAYQKTLVVRYTTDLWQTYTEVGAVYSETLPSAHPAVDRFTFALPLVTAPAATRRSLFFCLRYTVAGQEYWDNNAGHNYHVRYGTAHPGALTKTAPAPYVRRRSSSDPTHLQTDYFFNPAELGDYPRQLSSGPADAGIEADGEDEDHRPLSPPLAAAPRRTSSPALGTSPDGGFLRMNSTRLANRYDFGASLSAALRPDQSVPAAVAAPFSPLSASATRSNAQKYMDLAIQPVASASGLLSTSPSIVPAPLDLPFSALAVTHDGSASDLYHEALSSSDDDTTFSSSSYHVSSAVPIGIPHLADRRRAASQPPPQRSHFDGFYHHSSHSDSYLAVGGGVMTKSPSGYNLFSVSPTFASVSPTPATCIRT
ncbi:hypothetical protein IWQ60_005507 [Tieghemiomyces parasiticus]|uniref:CBM21 domain-containing protein n=1 Tax=Tieghemiomyces parasiticus TaxID=78921 RepID=A0A9W8DY57_9FUNG|nr:hypothetical protein IWQ60_005507 [Tieghemiomyces parasiticus]